MKVAFELPTKHIHALKEVHDFNFLLAQKVIDSQEYRLAYGMGGLMDNGQYELGEPLSITQLRIAERLAHPEIVIAPDWLGDREKTIRAYKEAATLLKSEVAGVVQGEDILDMLKCYNELLRESCVFICLPFRLDRVGMMKLVVENNLLSQNAWYHFLGLKSLDELREIMTLSLPYVSIDTSKPLKAALHNKQLGEDLRGLSFDWEATYTKEQVEAFKDKMIDFMHIAKDDERE